MLIKEFAEFSGVSVRTLHYYDEIGLLTPDSVDKHTGYRFYGEKSLLRMQEILFYRELDFPLKTIKTILSAPDYDKSKALQEQKALLTIKKERLERLIFAIEGAEKGENIMKAFDNSEFEKYKEEAKARWGSTAEYKEFVSKGKNDSDFNSAADGLMAIFAAFGALRESNPTDSSVQSKVAELQKYITDNFYTCSNEVLYGLGQIYVSDERFKKNIDSRGGDGTAEFVSRAIEIYCK